MSRFELPIDDKELAEISRAHLESVLAIDSQSDEDSESIPSTEGQRRLADQVAAFFEERGAEVTRDAHANVVASFPARGAGEGKAPVALMVHLDTTRGTEAVDELICVQRWQGERLSYPANPNLVVDVETYPAAREYVGQDILHGPGRAPVGLDDKLGLSHLMTLADLLARFEKIEHPPLVIVGRPDEEIGRMAAVEGLAQLFRERGVAFGYTVDGILPYEINTENFNASQASVRFLPRPLEDVPTGAKQVDVEVFGVNTHGCTAKEEGYRSATRLCAELLDELEAAGLEARIWPTRFVTSERRECDAHVSFALADDEAQSGLEEALSNVIDPHVPRGASWSIESVKGRPGHPPSGAALDMLRFVRAFMDSDPGFVLLAEDSEEREGYSNPYRALENNEGLRLDVRIRDFSEAGLEARERHVVELARQRGLEASVTSQYVNMGPRLENYPHLVELPERAAERLGLSPRVRPIRGGTGVDPFLERGVPIANLGTGYFALESQKEFTSMQMLAGHARWLAALVDEIARS